MRLILLMLVAILVLLQYSLWIKSDGVSSVHELKGEITKQEEVNQKLRDRNHQLDEEVRELKRGREAVEENARETLGMIKHGEKYYQILRQPEPKDSRQ